MTTSNSIYFNASELPEPKPHYVLWLDVMGSRNAMSQSLLISTNYIARLHQSVLEAYKSGNKISSDIRFYPVMDGVFVTTSQKKEILKFIRLVFSRLSTEFVSASASEHQFIIRAGLAFGPVIHGYDISAKTSPFLFEHREDYTKSLLFGMAMVQAFKGESYAPPFGIYTHESARAFASAKNTPFTGTWLRWWDDAHPLVEGFVDGLISHYAWCNANSQALEYPCDRIDSHLKLAKEYFQIK